MRGGLPVLSCLRLMVWRHYRSTRQRFRRAISDPLSALLRKLFLGEKRGSLFTQPIEEMARFPEATGIRLRAEDHESNLVVALRQPKQRGEAVARLADEAGLPTHHIHSFHDQPVRAVNIDSAAVGLHRIR